MGESADGMREQLELRIAVAERALQSSLQQLDDLGHVIDHDLRGPLRAICGFGKILQEEHALTLDPDGRELLRRLLEGAGRMTDMIQVVVELARLGKGVVNRSQFDLATLAHDAATGTAQRHPARKIHFDIQAGLTVNADRDLVATALVHLVDNAVKFTGPRASARIQVGSVLLAGERIFFVEDNGVGFAPEQASRIFRTFQRLHSTLDFPGAGVGLAAVQRIISRHEGRVWAESHPDNGTKIFFTLGSGPACAG